jgi:hypothetical protein
LSPHRRALAARSDARVARRWWSLYRTDAAACDKARVVWADIGRTLRATVLEAGDSTVPLNSCYVVRCPSMRDALALGALLNAPLTSAWLSTIAEQARGGYRRYLGWTMSLLPVPRDWPRWAPVLAGMAERARLHGEPVDAEETVETIAAAYGLRRRDVAALLTWTAE